MMAALIITVCLLDAPLDCKSVNTLRRLPMVECAIHGQMYALDYMRQYQFFEDWRLQDWTCKVGERA